jgi:putative DNA primase/helicase
MAARGIVPPDELLTDGKIHRCDVEGKNGKGDASYLLHLDGIPAGGFENFRDGLGWQNWRADTDRAWTPAEDAAHQAKVEAARKQRQADEAKRHEEARRVCALIWNQATPIDPEAPHPYLARKGVQSYGLRVTGGGQLIIPVRDTAGTLHSLQFIGEDGAKRFKTGGRKQGCYFSIGKPNGVLCIAEGYATGASIYEATGNAVAVAFDAGSLLPVAKALLAKLPDVKIILCADDDWRTEGNPGLTKATEAARAVDGLLAVPDFGDNRPDGAKDFNDMAALCGLEAVSRAIADASAPLKGIPYPEAETLPRGDSAAIAPESDDEAFARLAKLSELDYEHARNTEAERLRVRVSILDKNVRQAQRDSQATEGIGFDDIRPWPDPVDGAALLSGIAEAIARFIVCKPEVTQAAALWVAMTWFIDVVQVAPLAVITAPEKRCGKSQLLTLLGKLSHRPMVASNISAAALFRVIDAWQPSLMVDEADAFMKDNEELRGILNSGHTRDSAYVVRTVGEDFTPKQFSTWGGKAIAGIGQLADTLMDRSIVLDLRRKTPHEQVERLRYAESGLFDDLASRLCRFSGDNREAVRRARPELPLALHDRAQDNWEPLLAIADVAGGVWPEQARKAALVISPESDEAATIGGELLEDIREVFELKRVDRIRSTELIEALCSDDEKPWATYNRGKWISRRQVSKRLKDYGIKSKTIRLGAYNTPKGFEKTQFEDAFSRYLTPLLLSATPPQPNASKGFGVADSQNEYATKSSYPPHATKSATETPSATETRQPDSQKCGGVADKKGGEEEHMVFLPNGNVVVTL